MQRPRGENQQRILAYIKRAIHEKGYPPSVREIADAMGLKSTSTVHGHLRRLEEKGLLRRDALKPRALEVTGFTNHSRSATIPVPVLRDRDVLPELPVLNEANFEDYVPLPEVMLGRGEHFILRVRDKLPAATGIHLGDYVVVRTQEECPTGGPVVCRSRDRLCIRLVSDREPPAGTVVGMVVSLFRFFNDQ